MKKKVIHQLSLSDIGGVQKSFLEYFRYAQTKSKYFHEIYGMHDLSDDFQDLKKFYKNLNKSIFNRIRFIFLLYSKKYIIHFYNNLGSRRINKILNTVPFSNVIFHERGNSWNAKNEDIPVYRDNASKAKVILANSNASKTMLIERFGIDKNKIKVIYNGVFNSRLNYKKKINRYSKKLCIGYLGRHETNKSVHTVIETAKLLPQFKFFIAGAGTWGKKLRKIAKNLNNVTFIGKVTDTFNFISQMDIILVPSIREPLGNVIIEAGLCKKPVIASNIDGIPEIVENGISGILIDPDLNLSFKNLPKNSLPYPNQVINPTYKKLQNPKEVNPKKIAISIKKLKKNYNLQRKYGEKLYQNVKKKFCVERYFNNLEKVYRAMI